MACSTGTVDSASTPKPASVVRLAIASEASVAGAGARWSAPPASKNSA
jgi:hypothetical protein